jgi:hypothetical protein
MNTLEYVNNSLFFKKILTYSAFETILLLIATFEKKHQHRKTFLRDCSDFFLAIVSHCS